MARENYERGSLDHSCSAREYLKAIDDQIRKRENEQLKREISRATKQVTNDATRLAQQAIRQGLSDNDAIQREYYQNKENYHIAIGVASAVAFAIAYTAQNITMESRTTASDIRRQIRNEYQNNIDAAVADRASITEHERIVQEQIRKQYTIERQEVKTRLDNAILQHADEQTTKAIQHELKTLDARFEKSMTDSQQRIGAAQERVKILEDKKREDSHYYGSRAESEYLRAIKQTDRNLAVDIASKYGTAQEKEALQRIRADKEAQSKGLPNPHTATKADYATLRDIGNKYGSKLDSQAGIQTSIKQYARVVTALTKENALLDSQLNSVKQKLNSSNDTMRSLEQQTTAIERFQKILDSGVNSKGEALTETQIKNIKSNLEKLGNVEAIKAKYVEVKKENLRLAKQKNSLLNNIQANTNLINGIQNHSTRLQNSSKLIAKAVKAQKQKRNPRKNDKMLKKSVGNMMMSIKKVVAKVDKVNRQGNALMSEYHQLATQSSMMARRLQLAYSVAGSATVMLMLPGKIVFSSPMRAIRRFGLKHTNLSKFIGGTSRLGKGAFKLVKNAPIQMMNAPKMIEDLPLIALKKTALMGTKAAAKSSAFVVGRSMRAGLVVGKGAARLAGRGVKTATKPLAKGARAVGRRTARAARKTASRFASTTVGRAASAIGRGVRKAASVVLKPVAWVAKKLIWLLQGLFHVITMLFSGLISLATGLFALVGWILFAAIILVILLGIIQALWDAVGGFFKQFTIQEQSYVANQPEFIPNLAIQYRNEELEILEFLNKYKEGANSDSGVQVCVDPLYYNVFTKLQQQLNNSTLIYGSSYGAMAQNPTQITFSKMNSQSQALFESLRSDGIYYDSADNGGKAMDFKSVFSKYDSVKGNYYYATQLATDDKGRFIKKDGQYVLKPDAKPEDHEISNARDALALVDTLYTKKKETMQKAEALYYLGLGDAQMATSDRMRVENLFWATHKFIYNSGTKEEDIRFHNTTSTANGSYKTPRDCDNFKVYKLKKPQYIKQCKYGTLESLEDPQYTAKAYSHIIVQCKKSDSMYRITKEMQKFYALNRDNWASVRTTSLNTKLADCDKKLNDAIKQRVQTIGTSRLNANRIALVRKNEGEYVAFDRNNYAIGTFKVKDRELKKLPFFFVAKSGQDYMVNYNKDSLKKTKLMFCTEYYTVVENVNLNMEVLPPEDIIEIEDAPKTIEFCVCQGHLDLDVDIVVTTMQNGADKDYIDTDSLFFKEAANLPKFKGGVDHNFILPNYNKANDIWGFGDLEMYPFDPAEDWSDLSGNRGMASAKATMQAVKYEWQDMEKAKPEMVEHFNSKFKSFIKGKDGLFYYGYMWRGQPYYTPLLISGEQENIPAHIYNNSGKLEKEMLVDFINDKYGARMKTH